MLLKVVQTINAYLSDYVLIVLLIGMGVWFSVKTDFVQIRCFKEGMRKVFGNLTIMGERHESGMSSFQALATAIAAQVGTGNIVGASGAILTGGPGAIFWMWIIAFFGMATIYAEAVLAQETRIRDADGTIHGGPVYYIHKAYHSAFGQGLAVFFAVAAILALGFFGLMVQSNSIGGTFQTAFGTPRWIMGLILAALCAAIFLGGVQRLAAATEKIVPLMAALFLMGGCIILIIRIRYLIPALWMIVKYAFVPKAIIGGGFGAALKIAISQGAKRGLFSNEAGMGSTPHAHAQANVARPHDQGVVAMMGVFIDTFVVLTLNALVIITTMYTPGGLLADGYLPNADLGGMQVTVNGADMVLNNGNLSQIAFGTVCGQRFGAIFVAVCLFFFALSTILGWNFFGRVNMRYLFSKRLGKERTELVYTCISLLFVFVGTVVRIDLVWELQDMFDQLLVLPNAIALFALTGLVCKALRQGEKGERRRVRE